MLIVSKFHDYYDTAIGYGGVDKTVVYKRKTEKKEAPDSSGDIFNRIYEEQFHKHRFDYTVCKCVMGFCGQIFPFYHIVKKWKTNGNDRIEHFYMYDMEEMIDFTRKEKIGQWTAKRYSRYYTRLSDRTIKEYFAKDWSHLHKYFRKYKAPVFLLQHKWPAKTELMLNPVLRERHFAKRKDPFTAYQEIYMYLSGVLGIGEKEIVQIKDKYMLKKKGFDKWSFKKRPKKGKKK